MTPPSPARRLARALIVVSLVMSGVYMFVYLYRWEWNRALIAGVFFLGAEIALATSLILARLPAAGAASPAPPPAARAGPAPAHDSGAFAWLTPLARGERLGVFVPVLLGAGVVLSTLAFAVERLASVAARGAHRSAPPACQVAGLRLPAGGYLHRSEGEPTRATTHQTTRAVRLSVAAVLLGGAGIVGLDVLADATQARPDPRQAGTTTLVVQGERRDGPSATAALRLWERCRTLLPSSLRISTSSGRQPQLTVAVDTVLGPLAERKLRGCLEDASLPGIRGHVVSLQRDPALPDRA